MPVQLVIQPVDLVELGAQALFIEASGHRGVLGVVADRKIFVAKRLCGFGHLLEAALAVGCLSVHMEVALYVLQRDQFRQAAFQRRFDLATILAKLGLYKGETYGSKYFFFGAAANPLFAAEHAIFVDLKALGLSELADGDIVSLGAGKIMQGSAIAFFGDHAEVDLDGGFQDEGGLCIAARNDLGGFLITAEMFDGLRPVLACHQDIEVANRVLAAPVAACHGHIADAGPFPQERTQGLGKVFSGGKLKAPLSLGIFSGLLGDFCLDLCAETRQAANPVLFCSAGEFLYGRNAQRLVQGVNALRTKAWDRGKGCKCGRRAGFYFLKRRKAARSGDLIDFAGKILADARQTGKVFASLHHPRRTSGQIVDRLRGVAIGANAEGVCALNLKQIGETPEKLRYVCVMNRHIFMEAYLFE